MLAAHQRLTSGLQLVSDLRRSEEGRDCEAHPRRLSCQLVRCDQHERRRPTHAHDWLKGLRQRGVRKRRRTPTDIPPSGHRRWTQGHLGNARFRRPSSRADAILLRIDSRGAANGRFLRHRFSTKSKSVATLISLPKINHVAKEAVSTALQTNTRQRSERTSQTKRCSSDEAVALRKNHVSRRLKQSCRRASRGSSRSEHRQWFRGQPQYRTRQRVLGDCRCVWHRQIPPTLLRGSPD